MTGRDVAGRDAGPLLEVVELSVSYGGLLALSAVSFPVAATAVVGLIGPNGAGKTTCIDALTGFTRSTGRVMFDGERVDDLRPHDRARRGLTRTFQSVELFEDLTLRENLQIAAARPRWWGVLADALAPRRRGARLDVDWALETVGLAQQADVRPTELSHGQRRLAGIARALAGRPRLVLLDEPAAGLDTAETAGLGAAVRRLPELGMSVLLVDHDMGLVLGTCDTVHVLDFGAVIASGTPAEVRADPDVIRAYLGTEHP